jgi:hypothetical protein
MKNLIRIGIFSKTPDLPAIIQKCPLWKVLLCLKVEEEICKTVSKDNRAPLLVENRFSYGNRF